jgi:hypothetical protein
MPTSWFVEPELKPTTFTASYVCNNLSKHGEMMVRRQGPCVNSQR